MPFDYDAAKAQYGVGRAREMEQEQGNMAPVAASLGTAMGGGGFIPPEVMGGGGGVVNPGMSMGNPGGLGGGALGRVASGLRGAMGRGTPPPAGPYGGIMGGMGNRPTPSLPTSPSPANSTRPPMMRNGGVGGVAPRPAQNTGMRKMRGRGGMSMF